MQRIKLVAVDLMIHFWDRSDHIRVHTGNSAPGEREWCCGYNLLPVGSSFGQWPYAEQLGFDVPIITYQARWLRVFFQGSYLRVSA